jgi:hypothetical protein
MTAGTPWWQIALTVRRGYLLSGGNGFFGLLMLWAGLTVAPLLLVTAASFLLLAAWYLVSVLALRRQERSAAAAEPERQPGLPPSS